MLMLALTAAAIHAASVPTSRPALRQSACLGRSLDECLASLRAHLELNDQDIASARPLIDRVDVNGKSVRDHMSFNFRATWPDKGSASEAQVSLEFDAAGLIDKVNFGLISDPRLAKTQDEYDETGLYEVTNAVLGDTSCPRSDRLQLYRFFENEVKPTIGWARLGRRRDTYEKWQSRVLPLCGVRFVYFSLLARDSDFASRGNRKGLFGDATVAFLPAATESKKRPTSPRRRHSR
jgi:hypothetical protein